jgi:hypothetical protein
VTDRRTNHGDLAAPFRSWVNAALAEEIPRQVRAFCFNLYETGQTFGVELVGAPRFDPSDPDWACDEVFEYRRDCLEVPVAEFGGEWTECLATFTELVREYLQTGAHAQKLTSRDAVAVGFVDGSLNVVWKGQVQEAGGVEQGDEADER